MELTGMIPGGCVEDPSIWVTSHDDPSLLLPGPGGFGHVWIYDVEGERLVIWVTTDPGFDDDFPGVMPALLDTLVIEAP
jgi:hypothetical protein